MKVGILGHGFIGWTGGVDFIRTMTECLLPTRGEDDALAVLLPWSGTPDSIPPCYYEFESEFGDEVEIVLVVQSESGFLQAVRSHGIDVLMPALQVLPSWVGVPWVGYLYDFQHKYLPNLFAPQEVANRDQAFAAMLSAADRVIVNSASVAMDADRFFPNHRATVVPLPFSAGPQAGWLEDGEPSAYAIEGPYLILCNQFWIHKDHWTAFKAFAAIAAEFPDLQLVCTGTMGDHRHPTYMQTLQQLLAATGVAHRVRMLGHIPKLDQIALLKNARALVQTTLFEGGPGGGAVIDAVAVGVPCFVSNIPVNLEVNDGNVTFFEAGNDVALAAELRRFLSEPAPARPSKAELIAAGQARRARCGRILWQTLRDTLATRAVSGTQLSVG